MEVEWEKLTSQKKAWWNLKNNNNIWVKIWNHLNLFFIQQICTECLLFASIVLNTEGTEVTKTEVFALIEHIREMFK